MRRTPYRVAGITIVHVLIVIVVFAALFAVAVVVFSRLLASTRQAYDGIQISDAIRGCSLWAGNDNGRYPTPSALDLSDSTVPEKGELKDTTGNILSVLIYNGLVGPATFISTVESNRESVSEMKQYQYVKPAAALRPQDALWDPSFRGTPEDAPRSTTAAMVGNNSYAHLVAVGNRRSMWRTTWKTVQPLFSNRGPTFSANDSGPRPPDGEWKLVSGPLGERSRTLLMHGGRRTWEGVVGYSDGRTQFITRPDPANVTYAQGAALIAQPDNLFVSESDEALSADGSSGPDLTPWTFQRTTNAYLRPIAERRADGTIRVWRD